MSDDCSPTRVVSSLLARGPRSVDGGAQLIYLLLQRIDLIPRALSAAGGLLLDPIGTKIEERRGQSVRPTDGFGPSWVPATLSMSTLSLSTMPGRLAQQL